MISFCLCEPSRLAKTSACYKLAKVHVRCFPCYPYRSDAAQMYYFSGFTCHLNEPEPHVSPTDSRLRPDERLMEEGKFDEANQSKQKLEEQQRTRRRKREADAEVARQAGRVYEGYKPTWFEKTKDEYSDIDIFVYKGGYWEAKEKEDWSMCPVIYEKE